MWLIAKTYQGLALQQKFLDEFYMRSQDFSMPPPPNNQPQTPNAIFVVSAKYEKDKKLVRLIVTRGKPIQDVMGQQDQERTGLNSLHADQLSNLNAWLDPDKVVAPGDPPH